MPFALSCSQPSFENGLPPALRRRVGWLPRGFAAAISGLACVVVSSGAVSAECYPHCDYNHDYGPYDFSYKRPGLYAYPVCGPRGNCTPYLVYGNSGYQSGNIVVTFPRRPRPAPLR